MQADLHIQIVRLAIMVMIEQDVDGRRRRD
jgi:hypothetical protein